MLLGTEKEEIDEKEKKKGEKKHSFDLESWWLNVHKTWLTYRNAQIWLAKKRLSLRFSISRLPRKEQPRKSAGNERRNIGTSLFQKICSEKNCHSVAFQKFVEVTMVYQRQLFRACWYWLNTWFHCLRNSTKKERRGMVKERGIRFLAFQLNPSSLIRKPDLEIAFWTVAGKKDEVPVRKEEAISSDNWLYMISDADSDRSVSRDHSVLWSSNAEVERHNHVGSVF